MHRLVAEADIVNLSKPTAEQIDRLAKLPLLRQPGEAWEYGLSTDVLGHVLEVVSGKSLGEFVAERVLRPLGMVDTAFYTPPAKRDRLAEPLLLRCARRRRRSTSIDCSAPPPFEMAGTGLVSTIGDYARFLAMVAGGGALDGARVLGPRTLAYMASDHLGPEIDRRSPFLPPGHGYGLGFAVRTEVGVAPTIGSSRRIFLGRRFRHGVLGLAARRLVRGSDDARARPLSLFPPSVPQHGQRGDPLTAPAHQTPTLGIDAHGSAGDSAWPFCSSSIEMASGERMKAMRPSRGGRLIVTPAFIIRSQKA